MAEFPHLILKQKLKGTYHFRGIPMEKIIQEQTLANLKDRVGHASNLQNASLAIKQARLDFLNERKEKGLPDIFSEEVVPVFLQIDPYDFDIESLRGFGIEIISEEFDGYIIGANADNFRSLGEKINAFLSQTTVSKNQAAKLWQIILGDQWRIEHILSPDLGEKYNQGIADDDELILDISVACYLKVSDRPVQIAAESDEKYADYKLKSAKRQKLAGRPLKFRKQRPAESDQQFAQKVSDWEVEVERIALEKDQLFMDRQDYLTNFIEKIYGGELLSSFVDLDDSFAFRARMSGLAFKDFVKGYPYVFEISENDTIHIEKGNADPDYDFGHIEILAPSDDSPIVCVMDSGFQEEHILIENAVVPEYSKNYVNYENTTADMVDDGGHGTKVAGAILYGNQIPETGEYQPNCFLANARILDKDNGLPWNLYPPELMERIVDDFAGITIFNLSVTTRGPSRSAHMSAWASAIDKLAHDGDLLFIIAAGNIPRKGFHPARPGISDFIKAGKPYPLYLSELSSRISNPAQSLFGITVGSICLSDYEDADRISFGKREEVSSFSRSGPGIWGCIKPDIVEFGGDFLMEKNGHRLTQHNQVSTALVRAGGNRTGYGIGTSFAAPKVTHIAASLAKKLPNESALLYKALIIQSARLPEHAFYHPTVSTLNLLGYGIPNLNRATENSAHRITFTTEDTLTPNEANLYAVSIPAELRRPGDNFDILVEVTLTYTAVPRRTRKRLKSYLSAWLSWECSTKGEPFEAFSARVLKNMDKPEVEPNDEIGSIKWAISSATNWGTVKDVKRQDSATQKDWAIIKSNQLPEELCFAVVGHKGWEKDITKDIPFALAISFEALGKEVEIYKEISLLNSIEVPQEVRAF
ncbi:subtilisin family serine protease [Pedobacter sp. AK017]|uniref:S8 family peptidase n=1 Tax=Pedobacter sp. AK017 TaxID=2723073 RepID=UPI00161DE53C|nr:S8 family peptidase [Pedobacter sp. AK017]MBB5440244.1 subtilisin family serine protease [Pedobacter sp. AK017]